MQQRLKFIALALGLLSLAYVATVWQQPVLAQAGRGGAAPTAAAVPGDIGVLDPTGPYEVVAGWPKDLSTTPGNEKWTFGAGRSAQYAWARPDAHPSPDVHGVQHGLHAESHVVEVAAPPPAL